MSNLGLELFNIIIFISVFVNNLLNSIKIFLSQFQPIKPYYVVDEFIELDSDLEDSEEENIESNIYINVMNDLLNYSIRQDKKFKCMLIYECVFFNNEEFDLRVSMLPVIIQFIKCYGLNSLNTIIIKQLIPDYQYMYIDYIKCYSDGTVESIKKCIDLDRSFDLIFNKQLLFNRINL